MPETASQKINRFYSLINDYHEGAANTRYKSWEWCHQAFLENKNSADEKTIDLLSLHLAFYLASWGMYRGSSYLLQRDYKAHKPAIREILNPRYQLLWNYQPEKETIEIANDLLFNQNDGIYWKIKKSYKNYGNEDDNDNESSDTLTTKILMGTFACIPAFDRFLKDGISCFIDNHSNMIGNYRLMQSIEKNNKQKSTDSFMALATLVLKYPNVFKIESNFYYPPMKCLDMCLWEVGYESSIAKILLNKNLSNETKKKWLHKANELGYCDYYNNILYSVAAEQINDLKVISDLKD